MNPNQNRFANFPPPVLTIELVPYGQWFDNLRSRLTPKQWNVVKQACYVKAGHVCEVCGGKGKKHPVECHEIWHFDDHSHVQTLAGLIALCPSCHRVKHIGHANAMGLLQPTLRHMARINRWPLELAHAYANVAMQQWAKRSQHLWSLNLDWLDDLPRYLNSAAKISTAHAREGV